MDQRHLFSPAERRVLESLLRHDVSFMVEGLSGAVLQGAPVVTQDIDLWFENLGEPKMLRAKGPKCSTLSIHMSGLGSFAEDVKHALHIPLGRFQAKVLPLERILSIKMAANRPKERLVIPVRRYTWATLTSQKTV